VISDAIVVGGGFAGLAAARDLEDAGLSCTLLEGSERLGGRTYYRKFAGDLDLEVEFGGTYIDGRHHERVYAELDRYGLATEKAAAATNYRHALCGRVIKRGLPMPANEAPGVERALYALLSDTHRIQTGVGLDRQGLDDLDISVQEYVDRLDPPPVTREFLLSWSWNLMGQRPSDSSALWLLQFVAAHGQSVTGMVFSLDEIFASGTRSLVDAMASDVRDIRLGDPCVAIDQDGETVRVGTAGGDRIEARTAVLAIPLNTWADIRFTPALEGPRRTMAEERHGCRGTKLLILAENVPPGLHGAGYGGALATVYEYMPVGERRLLVSFTDTDSVDPADREAVERGLRQFVPDARVVAVDAHNWTTDPMFNGGWMSPKVGQMSRTHSRLSEPHGRVFFAGSDVSMAWPSYIEGAFETGARAAREVRAVLR
jgi:monoamine oxidase